MANQPATRSLMGLPGRVTDSSARKLREQFLADEIDIDEFLKGNAWRLPKTPAARFENQIQSYATASIVIDQFWTYLQKQPIPALMGVLREKSPGTSYAERVYQFPRYLNSVIGMLQNRFVKAEDVDTEERDRAREQRICFYAVTRWRTRRLKGLPFPSMKDLVTLLGRMAGVAPEVFRRDMGREASKEELIALLRHPSLLRFFVELMGNDRYATHPLFAKFEG